MSTSVVVLCCYWIKGASAIFCLLLMVLVLLSIHLQFGLFSICKREAWRQWWPQPSERELLQMVVGGELLQMVDYCYWRRRHACRLQHNAYSYHCQSHLHHHHCNPMAWAQHSVLPHQRLLLIFQCVPALFRVPKVRFLFFPNVKYIVFFLYFSWNSASNFKHV